MKHTAKGILNYERDLFTQLGFNAVGRAGCPSSRQSRRHPATPRLACHCRTPSRPHTGRLLQPMLPVSLSADLLLTLSM